ncbi:hypothetical protein Mapa_009387 [Marchantia paleacea]|nr:hypothetical protein Mapa_009387 [Marchantia paleacea]
MPPPSLPPSLPLSPLLLSPRPSAHLLPTQARRTLIPPNSLNTTSESMNLTIATGSHST